MRRTDRLFDLIQILRRGGLHTAHGLAAALEVSPRTIWRDMATLIAAGLPIEGARGVGYILRAPITLPPLTLTDEELTALTTALALLARGADPSLAGAAASLAGKIEAVLPASLLARRDDALFVWPGPEALAAARHLPALRRAIRDRTAVEIAYADAEGRASRRVVRPLGLEFWGKVWTLAAWCEARADLRAFRVDRIAALMDTGATFAPEPGRDLAAWQALHGAAG
jgi:predicted DNA-binding transcriptional regulator YafY